MRFFLLALPLLALCACLPAPTVDGNPLLLQESHPMPVFESLTQSGSTYMAKFATVSALNSGRLFVSDYYGELRFTLHKNEKIDCRFWVEGRIIDKVVYEGVNGFVEATSKFCTGRLQRDNTFEFQGAYTLKGPRDLPLEQEQTFTLRGSASTISINGDLILGSVLRNAVSLADADEVLDLTEGVAFEAVRLE